MGKSGKSPLLDRLIGEGWFDDEAEAKKWIALRRVLVDNQLTINAFAKIPAAAAIRIKAYYKKTYVNKGGLKLEHALKAFGISTGGRVALDCGASTGGFTDCLLVHGASLVYAVDAGCNQLAGKLRSDNRVVNLESTNLSDPRLLVLDPAPELITLDLSYLSLRKAVPIALDILHHAGVIVALVKPLFEVESNGIRQSGDINDPGLIAHMLLALCGFLSNLGCGLLGLTHSPVTGNSGTWEFFVALTPEKTGREISPAGLETQIAKAVEAVSKAEKFSKTNLPRNNA